MPPIRTYAAFLNSMQLIDMERTLPENSSIWKLSSWQEVKQAAMDELVYALYIDFALDKKDPYRKEAFVEIRRSRKCVISTIGEDFSREMVVELFPLIKLGLIDNLAFSSHLTSGEWSQRAKEHPASRLGRELLKRMAPRLNKLKTGSLKAAMETMFLKPRMIETVGDLARISGVNERSITRSLNDAGLASPNTLVIVSRLIHAFPLLKAGDMTLEAIATRCGWTTLKSFIEHWKQYSGMVPSVVKDECTEEEFLARVMLCLVKSKHKNRDTLQATV